MSDYQVKPNNKNKTLFYITYRTRDKKTKNIESTISEIVMAQLSHAKMKPPRRLRCKSIRAQEQRKEEFLKSVRELRKLRQEITL